MNSNSLERIIAILVSQSGADTASVTANTALEELGIDSFDFIEFVFLVEDEFGIQINVNYNDVGSRLKTVGDVAGAVDALVAAKSAGAEFRGEALPA